ncbi:MAG: hypothetical protein AW07_02994 [Candidatus Accumulibacter sp. SK-11]|nr:MAG: hypothetical protein AW07_02994 [Candidatus Accumulibacter sp. SK-11]
MILAEQGAGHAFSLVVLQRRGDAQEVVSLASEDRRNAAAARGRSDDRVNLVRASVEELVGDAQFRCPCCRFAQGEAAGKGRGQLLEPGVGLFAQQRIGLRQHVQDELVGLVQLLRFDLPIDRGDVRRNEPAKTAEQQHDADEDQGGDLQAQRSVQDGEHVNLLREAASQARKARQHRGGYGS